MTAAPLTIIGKIVYDSAHSATPPRPLGDLNFTTIFLRTEFDFTTDETVWASFIGAFPVQLMRVGLDQVIAQRFLAARSLTQARTSYRTTSTQVRAPSMDFEACSWLDSSAHR
ncbi:hypothetical protein MTO96_044478 [Rhipicephalus appendiculatus]